MTNWISCLTAFLGLLIPVTCLKATEPVDYWREIKPILAARCTSCHGAVRQKAGLRLDTAALLRQGGDNGPAIAAGNSADSLLIARVTGANGVVRMPPKSEGTPLTDKELALLKAWIDQGAKAPPEKTPDDPRRHWAFQLPVQVPLPPARNPRGTRNPIDAFLAAAHERQGLQPSPPVSEDMWLRRVYLDLIGLPPTREELHAFRADDTPEAYEKVVERLLASPHYGERWGRHWMDVWRYSDWFGLGQEVRFSHKHIWHWRDWIIEALNGDKGYDRMILEMLAGDELASTDPATLRATGFLVRSWYIFNRNFWLDDVVQHTSRGFLGLTLQCARCHDHKYDPISQADYYQLRAFFEPHLVRIDRLPGEPDRDKHGLPRVYDAWLDTPTYLFVRGDEHQPDKNRTLRPAVPAVLGDRALTITPVPLPQSSFAPDKQTFVIQETLAEAERAVVQARTVVETAKQNLAKTTEALTVATEADRQAQAKLQQLRDKHKVTAETKMLPEEVKQAQAAAAKAAEELARARQADRAAPDEIKLAELRRALNEAKKVALVAVVAVERLEDEGAKERDPQAWKRAAQETALAQRRLAVHEAQHNQIAARGAVARAQASLDGLTLAVQGQKENKNLPAAVQKAATDLVDARATLAAADQQLARAEADLQTPITTAYVPRALSYPRAKVSYSETPPNDPYPKVSTGRRLALARWIADRQNPLTARVAVNHIWARHFGEPLVPSMFDFGLRTQQPVHHELLDWLAVDFMEAGWSMKHLHRRMVLSEAYRRRSSSKRVDDPNAQLDPDNRYFWRMQVRRMEGEILRDSLLHLAGQLDPKLGGPDLPTAQAETGKRRTVYYRYARDDRVAFLTLFDAPSVEECYRRHETIVPQQALVLSNSKMALTRARELAAVISQEVGSADSPPVRAAFVTSAFERILGRLPTPEERAECEEALTTLAASSGAAAPSAAQVRARESLIHVLLNHNDFITIR